MKILLLTLFLITPLSLFAKDGLRVTYISPDPIDTENEFWKNTTKQIMKAAKDLGIELEVLYTQSHYSYYTSMIDKVSKRPKETLPQYLLILPIKSTARNTLEKLEKVGVKTVFINAEVNENERESIGWPRQKYKNWIGEFYPDDYQAAKLVVSEVAKKCRKGSDVVAINGTHFSNASLIREKSFEETSKELNLNLKQSFYGNWRKDKVGRMLPYIEGRYPNICGFFVSSDFMAEAILNSRLMKYQVCSIDWTKNGLQNVNDKKQLCTVGGHFLEPAFALVATFDYHHGYDFKNDFGLTYKSHFYIANQSNAKEILEKFIENKKPLNFKNYSKVFNKKIKKYNFNILKNYE
ncbi:ABC transporter substrate-binding protein [Halobacteriovorax marinus]|uniref:ABC transporter substrate-binding protein n=1 Tax=Halobacteriovorax marinus TaxID=97084 RepID=UPI003A90FAEF